MHDDDKALLMKWRRYRRNSFLTLAAARELERTDSSESVSEKENDNAQ